MNFIEAYLDRRKLRALSISIIIFAVKQLNGETFLNEKHFQIA